MSGIWYVIVPEVGTNYVKNPSAEAPDNFDVLHVGSPSTSASPSFSTSPSGSNSPSASQSNSPSASQSRSPSASQSRSPSASASPSGSSSPSGSVSVSPSPSAGIAAIVRDTTRARFGNYCYQVTPNTAYEGLALTLSALSNAIHYVSLYMFDNVTGTPQVALDDRAFYDMTVIGGADGSWQRWGVQIPAANASGSTRLSVRLTTAEVFSIDAVQVEQNNYGTTYIDGDRAGLYKWSGLRHGSYSVRSAQERSGGRERNLLDDYGVEVVEGTKRIGVPPVTHNLLGMALLPGAQYQGTKVLPREIELRLNYSSDTWAGFHGKRSDVFDLLKPDLVSGSQPIVIGYAGAATNKKVYSSFYYSGGMEFGDFLAYDEIAQVRLLAPDPYWYADDQQTASLDYQDTLTTTNYAHKRINGQWSTFGSGFTSEGYGRVVKDNARGRVYYAGSFTAANGSAVGFICYWDGSAFVQMRGGLNSTINSIAIAPNGDVWVVGAFTSVDGQTTKGVAKWNYSTSTWTAYNLSGTGAGWYAVAISNTGIVYIGGYNINWNGDAAQDYIAQYDGSSWSAVGTSPFGADDVPYSMEIDQSGYLLVGTNSNSAAASVRRWDGSVWTTLATTNNNATIYTILAAKSGDIYIGGDFTTIGGITVSNLAKYSNSAMIDFCGGTAATVYDVKETARGELLISGVFSLITATPLADGLILWNGSTFASVDIDMTGSPVSVYQSEIVGDDIYLLSSASGTAAVSGITNVTNGGTSIAFPRFSVINANTSGTCLVQWLENQSSDHRMFFNLTVQAGETVMLDLSDSQKRLTSDWRGVITNNPLRNSDVVNWRLLPGANTVAAFITGTVTSVVALLHWTPVYWSADGPA